MKMLQDFRAGGSPMLPRTPAKADVDCLVALCLLPILLLSCGAMWQSDSRSPIELARTGEYKRAAPLSSRWSRAETSIRPVVESLYYSWVRSGEYTKAREKFEAWATANPNAGPLRLAAGRINHIIGKLRSRARRI